MSQGFAASSDDVPALDAAGRSTRRPALSSDLADGEVPRPDLPHFVRGSGPDLIFLPGLSFTNNAPIGLSQLAEAGLIWRLVARHRVHWVGRALAAPAHYRIPDHARDVAAHIRTRFTRPVPVVGFSTGGFIGLQLAIDHPDVVSRLVVIGAGARLTDAGRASDLRWADALAERRNADAWRETAADLVANPRLARGIAPILAAIGTVATPADCTDGIATARAESSFDVSDSLTRLSAPTLLITGQADRNCGPALGMTARRDIADAELLVLARTGHTGSLIHHRAMARTVAFLRRD